MVSCLGSQTLNRHHTGGRDAVSEQRGDSSCSCCTAPLSSCHASQCSHTQSVQQARVAYARAAGAGCMCLGFLGCVQHCIKACATRVEASSTCRLAVRGCMQHPITAAQQTAPAGDVPPRPAEAVRSTQSQQLMSETAHVASGPYHCHTNAGMAVVRTTGLKSRF
eukprot:63211-Chlamydomonas_euryale.AAC.2